MEDHILNLIHINVYTMDARTFDGILYFVTFIDNHSQKVWVFILKSEDHMHDVFKYFHVSVKREM